MKSGSCFPSYFEYEHPYLDGVENFSRNRTFKTRFFNSRKLSPIFGVDPSMDAAPPIWIDRVGLKANITEVLPNGATMMDGPPTTFSGTGVDQMAFLQANMTRDNTEFVNGASMLVDQNLGIGIKTHCSTVINFL